MHAQNVSSYSLNNEFELSRISTSTRLFMNITNTWNNILSEIQSHYAQFYYKLLQL